MEMFQRATSPWGEDILVRVSWDLLWFAVIGSAIFLLIHQVLRRRWIGKKAEATGDLSGIPEKVARHTLPSRLFHWVMAASMLVLLFTGFLPIVGITFSWVVIHWWAGVALIACVIFHMVHATVRWTFKEVWISLRDMREWWASMRAVMGSGAETKPGKYPVDNKLYHYAIIVTSLGVAVTGVLMMMAIDTPFFARDPYFLSEGTWGLVFVIHGLAAIGLVGLVIAHIYFAILPEKLWMTKAMIFGWITRKNYTYYDSERWSVEDSGESPGEAPVDAPVSETS